jgi:glycosyltransferase involved in cell wall biosynthesis
MIEPSRACKSRVVLVNRFYRPDQSATSQILTDLASGLAERGHEVHVICSRLLYEHPEARLPARERLAGVEVHRIATTHFGRARLIGRAIDYLSFYFSSTVMLLRLVKRRDVLVVKTDPPLMSVPAAAVARLRRALLVNWQQDVFPEISSELGSNPLPRWLDRGVKHLRDRSLRAARMNVVIGSRMLDYFASRSIPREKLCVIENWADGDSIVPKQPCESALRHRLNLGGRFVIGYSGNLGRVHEYDAVLGAVEALEGDRSVAFLFIGGGVKMDALKAQSAKRQWSHVIFQPYQPRELLEDSLAAADVHLASLIPSLEGLVVPSKFYGILAAGRPVIFVGDPDGELARVIAASRCGLVVGPGRTQDLVAAIRRLQQDSELRRRLGAAARKLLTDRYSAARGVQSWFDLLRLITGAGADGPLPPPLPGPGHESAMDHSHSGDILSRP